MYSYGKIGIIAVVAIGIAAMMIPGGSLVSRAFADSSASNNDQSNSASNSATVHISNGGHHDNKSGHSDKKDHKSGGKISDSGNVHQDISQSNDISASNTGSGGSASADFNSQSNDASNSADVSIHNHGSHGKISHSGNVDQSITQSNSISASNTGGSPPPCGTCITAPVRTDGVSGGSASADFNTQSNSATNTADVDIHNHGGKISHSGNVDQSITQSNDIQVSNSGSSDGCGVSCSTALEIIIPGADANFNTQSNDATNTASVDISGHGGSLSHSGNVDQSITQSNSINATSTSGGGCPNCG
ncbi:MAG TPA: hypothetical protein VFI73_03420 [Candidatus Nitrosopolaris sp.]|nr:hypothetical protein [Candidatus Nitrosopolaris sp.]